MSSLLYHKELTDAKWHRIKFLFEKPKKVGHPSLNPRTVLNGILWILSSGAAWRGAICLIFTVIGTAATINSVNDVIALYYF
ncbi:MAG: transposase [Selenomonadaceae bacterium]|nr:transposase [Selenomonadaceae bacterium]